MILILGSKGMLGRQLMKVFGNDAVGWDRGDFDFAKISNFEFRISNLKPAAVINCVAYNDVDGAEQSAELAYRINAEAVGGLAKICKELSIPLVHFSTNYVFDGEKGEYSETDEPHPLSVYAESKYAGERAVIESGCRFYLIRTAVLFGPKGQSKESKKSFVELMLELRQKNDKIKAVTDEINSLTFAPDLSKAVKDLIDDNCPFGVYHITNSGQASWYDLAKEIFSIKNLTANLVPVSSSEFPRKAVRPKKSVLINTKLPALRSWQAALREYLITNY